jgi:hypothetical protein
MKSQWLWLVGGIALGTAGASLFSFVSSSPGKEQLGSLPAPYYSILFENDDVRVVEHRLEPGEREPMHEHPPMFVYFLEDANERITVPDGSRFEEAVTKGMTLEADRLSHAIENLGSTSVHSILVELKSD